MRAYCLLVFCDNFLCLSTFAFLYISFFMILPSIIYMYISVSLSKFALHIFLYIIYGYMNNWIYNYLKAVSEHGGRNWKMIALQVPGKNEVQCLHRWAKVLHPTLTKGPWTDEEDRRVTELVMTHGAKKWSLIAQVIYI